MEDFFKIILYCLYHKQNYESFALVLAAQLNIVPYRTLLYNIVYFLTRVLPKGNLIRIESFSLFNTGSHPARNCVPW